MAVLIIGGDYIENIKQTLAKLGEHDIIHWDARNQDIVRKKIPERTTCILFLTSYLRHNTMYYFKKLASKKKIKTVYAEHSASCVFAKFCGANCEKNRQ